MPLLLTLAEPLTTTSGLPVGQLYAIINRFQYDRLARRADFVLAYYAFEAASLPGSGLEPVATNLPTGFGFVIAPTQLSAVGDPQQVMEAYAQQLLQTQLGESATIENVA